MELRDEVYRRAEDPHGITRRRRDLAGMMATYAPEAQELLPGSPALVGWEAMRRFYAGLVSLHGRYVAASRGTGREGGRRVGPAR